MKNVFPSIHLINKNMKRKRKIWRKKLIKKKETKNYKTMKWKTTMAMKYLLTKKKR